MTDRQTSKLLSYVLRHKPESVGVELDQHGWVDLNVLIEALKANGKPVDRASVERVVAINDKQRFVIREGRIRANQGHSIDIELALPATQPPEFLYHGTATRHLEAIQTGGLRKMNRRHVHLSADVHTAVKVGQRHGVPVVLRVRAGAMAASGRTFHVSENGVWLVEAVAPEYLEVLDSDEVA